MDKMFYSKAFQSDIQIIHEIHIVLYTFLYINFTYLKI